jgi:U1 small nuclear ribonucleoprotein
LREYVPRFLQYIDENLSTCSSSFPLLTLVSQIRIVVDTHQDEKPNKKKKKHRGYAFVVYEREKDMRGKPDHNPLPPQPCSPVQRYMVSFVKIWPSSCLSSLLFQLSAQLKV